MPDPRPDTDQATGQATDPDTEFLRQLSSDDPQVRKRAFTVLLRTLVAGRGAAR